MVDGKWGGRGYLVRAVGRWVILAPLLCVLPVGELGLGLVWILWGAAVMKGKNMASNSSSAAASSGIGFGCALP